MPIGKNAIKRVANNGYSNVKTTAPDMENSTVEEIKKTEPKKNQPKNPVPKAVTSKTKSASSSRVKNPAPKAAVLLEGMQKIPAVKKTPAKAETKIKEVAEEVKEEIKEAAAVLAEITEEEVKEAVPVPKKSMETEPELALVRTLEKVTENTERNGEGYTNLGGSLPYYLL